MDAGRHVSNHDVLKEALRNQESKKKKKKKKKKKNTEQSHSLGKNVVCAIFSCAYYCYYLSDRKIALYAHAKSHETRTGVHFRIPHSIIKASLFVNIFSNIKPLNSKRKTCSDCVCAANLCLRCSRMQ